MVSWTPLSPGAVRRCSFGCWLGILVLGVCLHLHAAESSDAQGFFTRGQAKAKAGDFKGAVADYDRAEDLDPQLSAAIRERGFAKYKLGDFDGAVADCTHALDLDRDDVAAAMTRGYARQASGDLDGAVSDFTRVISRTPQNALAYEARAVARGAKHNAVAAMADFEKALELEPKFSEAYRDRAELRMRTQSLDRAMADLDQAIAYDPKDLRAHTLRREVRMWKAEQKAALEDADDAVKLDPKNPQEYTNRSVNYMLLSQWPEAQNDCRKSIELSGASSDDAHLYLWLLRTRAGETVAAGKELADYLAKRPAGASADWFATAADFLLGKVTQEALLAASIAPKPFDAHRLYCRAWYYIGMKQLFANDKAFAASLAHCIMDDQLSTPEVQLAVTQLGVSARPPRENPQVTLNKFIEAIPFQHAYTIKDDEHSVTFLSKKGLPDSPQFAPEAVLDFFGPMPCTSPDPLDQHLLVQIDNIRKHVPIGPYGERDHAPSDNVVHFIESIDGVEVGFIKYWIQHPNRPVPPAAVQAVILKDKKQYTFTLTTFLPETQEGYRQDLRLLIETLIKNGKL